MKFVEHGNSYLVVFNKSSPPCDKSVSEFLLFDAKDVYKNNGYGSLWEIDPKEFYLHTLCCHLNDSRYKNVAAVIIDSDWGDEHEWVVSLELAFHIRFHEFEKVSRLNKVPIILVGKQKPDVLVDESCRFLPSYSLLF